MKGINPLNTSVDNLLQASYNVILILSCFFFFFSLDLPPSPLLSHSSHQHAFLSLYSKVVCLHVQKEEVQVCNWG